MARTLEEARREMERSIVEDELRRLDRALLVLSRGGSGLEPVIEKTIARKGELLARLASLGGM